MRAAGRPETESIGLVLAGGRASRFGADKLAVELAGRPVLHHAIAAVASVTGRVLVSLANDAPAPVLPVIGRPIELVRDRSGDLGPLAGLAAALDVTASMGDCRLLVVPGDAPSLLPPLAARACCGSWTRPMPPSSPMAMTGARCRPPCAPARPASSSASVWRGPDRSVRGVLRALRPSIVAETVWRAWDAEGAWRDDIDEPADMARAAARAHQEAT